MKYSRPKGASEISVTTLRRIAGIIGNSSAAEQAITELERQLALKVDATIYVCGPMYFVGPRIRGSKDGDQRAREAIRMREGFDKRVAEMDAERGRPLTETEKARNLFRAIYDDEIKAAKREARAAAIEEAAHRLDEEYARRVTAQIPGAIVVEVCACLIRALADTPPGMPTLP